MDELDELMLEDNDWQFICEHSLFANRILQLEKLCTIDYNNNNEEFINYYLKPVVELLDTVRSRCEDYYSLKCKKENEKHWSEQFENIIKYAIHPKAIDKPLHKGEYYIHISETLPRILVLKYYCGGEVLSRDLSMTDSILMCSENWTELLKSELRDRFVFSLCILWTKEGFEKVTWTKLLKAQVIGIMEEAKNQGTIQSSIGDTFSPDELTMKPMLILDVNFELLHSKVAYNPGTRDKRGGPVIFFHASEEVWENADASSQELVKLLMYYYELPRESVQHKGCSLVIDAREGQHTKDILECIGEAIMMFQNQVPGSVHMAYVLTKKDSLMLLFAASKIKEKLNFEFQFLSSVEKLCREIDVEQLPEEFGGKLKYNHESWIKFRTKVEPFMAGCRSAAKHAMGFVQELNKTNIGNTADDCKKILEAYKAKVDDVFKDSRLLGLKTEGQQLIERLKKEEGEEFCNSDDFIYTMDCLNRLYEKMLKVFDKLRDISEKRIKNLELCLKVRKFEEDTQMVTQWMRHEGIPYLDKNKDVADSIGHATSMMDEFEKFTDKADENSQTYKENMAIGKYLIDLEELEVDRDILNKRLQDLENLYAEFNAKFNERKKKLTQCIDFHTFIEEATKWWVSGMQHIAHLNMEEIQTLDGIARLKKSIEEFVANNPPVRDSKIARITELAHHLGSKQVEQAEQVKSQCLEINEMFQKKQNQISGAEERYKKLHRDSLICGSEGDETSSGFKDDDFSSDDENYDDIQEDSHSESTGSGQYGQNSAIFSWKDNESPYDENDSKLAVIDAVMPAKMKERIKHIIDEMITTEHEYVKSLEYILVHYLPLMDMETLPPTLKGKANILFGNIERIYEFHKRFFSQEVETFRHSPLQIGKCFLKWERQFYLYALYNKNKPKSDQLLNDFGNEYFQTKMKALKDKLDLASYLIKPVQRLGKYALLLRDMINCCDPKDPRVIEINAAHELMKFQLRHGNDLLAMDAIKDSDINLKDQGCLLRQADFQVWYGRRKKWRRVFMFEHVIVFCKEIKQKAKYDIFKYKHSIKMVDVGLTENIGDSGLKFEIWYRRWKKGKAGESFILTAGNEAVKKSWTLDLTRILWRQATRNKEYGLTEASTGISVESTPSAVLIDTGGSNSMANNQNVYSRSRTFDIPSPTREQTPSKRLSWMSAGESSNSSGVFDLGSLPEDGQVIYSPRDESRGFFKRSETDSRYGSLQRKKLQYPNQPVIIENTDIAPAVNNMSGDNNSSFIRNNVFRKTVQIEGNKHERAKTIPKKRVSRRHSANAGRYATQPIVLPSNINVYGDYTSGTDNSNSLPRLTKKSSLEGPQSPTEPIIEHLEEETKQTKTENIHDVKLRRLSLNADLYKNKDAVYREKPKDTRNSVRITLRHSQSFDDTFNINDIPEDFKADRSSTLSSSSEHSEQKELLNAPENSKIKRYSFTKSLTVIDIDAAKAETIMQDKQNLNRQRSASTSDNSVYAIEPNKLKSTGKNKAAQSTVALKSKAEGKRKAFQNLKKKFSKSLSEI